MDFRERISNERENIQWTNTTFWMDIWAFTLARSLLVAFHFPILLSFSRSMSKQSHPHVMEYGESIDVSGLSQSMRHPDHDPACI